GFVGQYLGQEFAFAAQALMAFFAVALVFRFMIPAPNSVRHASMHGFSGRVAVTVSENRGVFMRVGPAVIALGLLRQARQVFLPLWGDQIGLSAGQIGLITSASFFVDAAMFYPIALIMDSKGRKWVAVPCLAILATGLLVLPLTYDFGTFLAVGMLTGLGNGLGSGINMTLGADFSPATGRGEFLGVWRLISDIGQASGPLVIGALTGIGSLAVASLASGGIGVGGAAIMLLLVPETLNRAHRAIVVARAPAEEPTAGSG
ncbi:MAG TPA: MFS transporter, partial [Dehalococcoidia bacterium]|nr:MFS transporter [Dehalococcoidia bacterium]